jgi:hypothetical protein
VLRDEFSTSRIVGAELLGKNLPLPRCDIESLDEEEVLLVSIGRNSPRIEGLERVHRRTEFGSLPDMPLEPEFNPCAGSQTAVDSGSKPLHLDPKSLCDLSGSGSPPSIDEERRSRPEKE